MKNQIVCDNDFKNVSREELIEQLNDALVEVYFWRDRLLDRLKVQDSHVRTSFRAVSSSEMSQREPEETLIDHLLFALESR